MLVASSLGMTPLYPESFAGIRIDFDEAYVIKARHLKSERLAASTGAQLQCGNGIPILQKFRFMDASQCLPRIFSRSSYAWHQYLFLFSKLGFDEDISSADSAPLCHVVFNRLHSFLGSNCSANVPTI